MRPPAPRNFKGEPTPQRRPTFMAQHGPDPAPYNRILGEQPHINTPMQQAVQRPHHLNALPLVPMNAARERFQPGKPSKSLFQSMASNGSLRWQLVKRPPGKAVVSVYAY
jgi:hypothetical protein